MPEDIVGERENVAVGGAGGGARDPRVAYREPPADAEDLIRFVHAVEVVVRACLERPALFGPYGRSLRETMPMLEADFAAIVRGLESATGADLERLAQHGLVGPELDFKLKVFYGASSDFLLRLRRYDGRRLRNAIFGHPATRLPLESAWPENAAPQRRLSLAWIRASLRNGLKGAAGLGLKAADAVLGSIGAAIPGVAIAAAALGETKGIMEAIADSDLAEGATEPEANELPPPAVEEPVGA
jgi:hypothetical protein